LLQMFWDSPLPFPGWFPFSNLLRSSQGMKLPAFRRHLSPFIRAIDFPFFLHVPPGMPSPRATSLHFLHIESHCIGFFFPSFQIFSFDSGFFVKIVFFFFLIFFALGRLRVPVEFCKIFEAVLFRNGPFLLLPALSLLESRRVRFFPFFKLPTPGFSLLFPLFLVPVLVFYGPIRPLLSSSAAGLFPSHLFPRKFLLPTRTPSRNSLVSDFFHGCANRVPPYFPYESFNLLFPLAIFTLNRPLFTPPNRSFPLHFRMLLIAFHYGVGGVVFFKPSDLVFLCIFLYLFFFSFLFSPSGYR